MWRITLRHKYPSHFPVGSRPCWFAGARKGRKFSLSKYFSPSFLPNASFANSLRRMCEDICPYSKSPILVQMILLEGSNFYNVAILRFPSRLSAFAFRLTEEASLIGRLHLKSFHNYTIILKMHVCMLLSLHQFTALSAQLRLALLSVDANSPHLAPNEA